MTTTTIQKIAAALKAANEEIHAQVRYNPRHHTWEVWVENKAYEVNFKDFNEAEDRCENLNYEYAARKVLESLKGDVPYYNGIKPWRDMNSTEVWNAALDHALNEKLHI